MNELNVTSVKAKYRPNKMTMVKTVQVNRFTSKNDGQVTRLNS